MQFIHIISALAIAVVTTPFFALCNRHILGALQQSSYNNRIFFAWTKRKGNMVYSRYNQLSLLILLGMSILAIGFIFLGDRYAGYISNLSILIFTILFIVASKKALKVPLVYTKRVKRIFIYQTIFIFILTTAFAFLAEQIVIWCNQYSYLQPFSAMRFAIFIVIPLLYVPLLMLANCIDSPYSKKRNREYVQRAKEKLANCSCKKIAITGSFGKTSVKNILKTILEQNYTVLATPKSYNTPVGIAKTIENVNLNDYQFIITEMGARNVGDIAELCNIVHPDYSIITGICPQHFESFKSIEAIIQTKGEILQGTNTNGLAILAADKNTQTLFAREDSVQKILVGENGTFTPKNISCSPEGTTFTIEIDNKDIAFQTKLLGRHCANNIALAVALCVELGMPIEKIVQGVAMLDYIPHRLALTTVNGVNILDDAFSTNCVGAKCAIEVLKLFTGRKIVVTCGIVELGILEAQENKRLGEYLCGLDSIILVGGNLVSAVKSGYLEHGGNAENIVLVSTLQEAQNILKNQLKAGDTVLFLNDLPDIYN